MYFYPDRFSIRTRDALTNNHKKKNTKNDMLPKRTIVAMTKIGYVIISTVDQRRQSAIKLISE